MKEIEKVVSEVLQVSIEAMHTKRQLRSLVWARQLTWKYTKDLDFAEAEASAAHTKKSLSKLGAYFGKDHATVLHGIKRINDLIETDHEVQEIYREISNRVPLLCSIKELEEWCTNVGYR